MKKEYISEEAWSKILLFFKSCHGILSNGPYLVEKW
jgi:hypothetical protein